jgi:hypothetical protein
MNKIDEIKTKKNPQTGISGGELCWRLGSHRLDASIGGADWPAAIEPAPQ